MPYTKSELGTVKFYQDFVTKLRTKYFDEIKKFVNSKFKKKGIFYSFEDIYTGLGLEDSITGENSEYSFLVKEDYSMYTQVEINHAKNNPEIQLVPELTDARENQYSKPNTRHPVYEKGEVLDKVINREISNDYRDKFRIYCLITEKKIDEAQLQYDLLKERGFKDSFYNNKINYYASSAHVPPISLILHPAAAPYLSLT